MAGIYVHIPFCKVKCHYCDFHFSVQLKNRKELIHAIGKELHLRKDFLNNEVINTIYFGGGTPSVVETELLEHLFVQINENFEVSKDCEITVECNPDDLTEQKLKAYATLGVNRLSIGIQSFDDNTLRFMNRAHNAGEARKAVKLAKKCGFNNLTIDLIYGVPGSSLESWKKELDELLALDIPHLSAYCLTIEENTVFGNWQKKGKLIPFSDEESLKQLEYLLEFMDANGFEQYEISNFSKPNFISKHNSAYWKGEKYIGVGPSAHSYNRTERGWNVSSNPKYVKCIESDQAFYEHEVLSLTDNFNDYILTRLRTKWGIDTTDLKLISEELTQKTIPILNDFVKSGELEKTGDIFCLTKQGKFVADAISADLFS